MKQIIGQNEALFPLISGLLDNTDYLFWVYDQNDKLVFANRIFLETCNITEDCIGQPLQVFTKKEETKSLILSRLYELRTESKSKIFFDKVVVSNSIKIYESNWFLLEKNNQRYVAGYSIDITAKRKQSQEIRKLASRLSYVSLLSSDMLWEWDADKNHLHLNERAQELSGYYKEVKYGGLAFWLLSVIHSKDRREVLRAFVKCINRNDAILDLSYRITTRQGVIKSVCDKIHIVYQQGKPVRLIGAIKDYTQKISLEKMANTHKEELQKAVSSASVHAQEEERDRLSKELHDNVNQLMLSSKMYISIAKNQPANANEMLDKAIEYQLQALEESRKLSRQMSNSIIEQGGFAQTVDEIFNNLKLNGINVSLMLNSPLLKNLSSKELLMLTRIIQEQTSNIIKYAEAKMVTMSVSVREERVFLSIKDDGKGFDPTKISGGIGFTNMKSRVAALGGVLNIEASPGEGCMVLVAFDTTPAKQFAA
jgi:PAS domain S-box-containing protein